MSNTQTPARQPKKRSGWVVAGTTSVSFVALLYVVEFFDQIDGHHLDDYGIRPMETDGLWGILFAPLLPRQRIPVDIRSLEFLFILCLDALTQFVGFGFEFLVGELAQSGFEGGYLVDDNGFVLGDITSVGIEPVLEECDHSFRMSLGCGVFER